MTDKLTTREKSVMLAKAMGWEFGPQGSLNWELFFAPPDDYYEDKIYYADLYNPRYMALAWRVLNWAATREDRLNDYGYPYVFNQNIEWLFDTNDEIKDQIWALPPEQAQAAWLDRVLETAIEAGLVTPESPGRTEM